MILSLMALLTGVGEAAPRTLPPALSDFCRPEQLVGLDRAGLRRARNTVLARHGRAFKSEDLQRHFASTGWYRVDPAYSDSRLTTADQACITRIRSIEDRFGKGTLFDHEVDLDGDGRAERITVTTRAPQLLSSASADECAGDCTVRVQIGLHADVVRLHWPAASYWGEANAIRLRDLDTTDGHRELVVTTHGPDDEDPGMEHAIFSLIHGRVIRADWSTPHGSAFGDGISVSGNRLVVDHRGCPTGRVTYRLDQGRLTETSRNLRIPNGWSACPACPYVYQYVDGRWRSQGEILRWMIGAEAEGWQSLGLADGTEDLLRVRIAEKKPEISYIDAVRAVVDGRELVPSRCADDADWEGCEVDGRHVVLQEGETLDLEFHDAAGADRALHASGYYVPVGAAPDARVGPADHSDSP